MNTDLCQKLGLRFPVVQAGMGGGIAGPNLAAAVSRGGGLGTVGISAPDEFRTQLQETRRLCGEVPFAANLLMPFTRRAHVDICLTEGVKVVVMFYGYDADVVARLQHGGIVVWQQVGELEQARRALADGVDGLIAQGVEAGGHLAGTLPLAELLPALRTLVPRPKTLLAAGGIFDAASARRAMLLGADGVVAGTRFLLTPECDAHAEYKSRLLSVQQTLRTTLFGVGWLAPHRVVPNAATRRWANAEGAEPAWVRTFNRVFEPSRHLLPLDWGPRMVALQRPGIPLFTPFPLTTGMDAALAEVSPLYAGKCVSDIDAIMPAAEVVAELARGC